jgi:hypothetical protein
VRKFGYSIEGSKKNHYSLDNGRYGDVVMIGKEL